MYQVEENLFCFLKNLVINPYLFLSRAILPRYIEPHHTTLNPTSPLLSTPDLPRAGAHLGRYLDDTFEANEKFINRMERLGLLAVNQVDNLLERDSEEDNDPFKLF